jgi:hypothetical protein
VTLIAVALPVCRRKCFRLCEELSKLQCVALVENAYSLGKGVAHDDVSLDTSANEKQTLDITLREQEGWKSTTCSTCTTACSVPHWEYQGYSANMWFSSTSGMPEVQLNFCQILSMVQIPVFGANYFPHAGCWRHRVAKLMSSQRLHPACRTLGP